MSDSEIWGELAIIPYGIISLFLFLFLLFLFWFGFLFAMGYFPNAAVEP